MAVIRVALLVALLVGAFATPLRAGTENDATVDVLRDAIRANKRAFIAVNLPLTSDEAARFWPIDERYEGELKVINDRAVKLLDEYTANFATLSDDRAAALIAEYVGAEADRAQLRRTYLAEFTKALPGRKVARFYQLENKMDAVVRYDLAAQIPVVDAQAPGAAAGSAPAAPAASPAP